MKIGKLKKNIQKITCNFLAGYFLCEPHGQLKKIF